MEYSPFPTYLICVDQSNSDEQSKKCVENFFWRMLLESSHLKGPEDVYHMAVGCEDVGKFELAQLDSSLCFGISVVDHSGYIT
jgi:hypothetical protein